MGNLALAMAWTKAPSVLSWARPPLPGLVYSTVTCKYLGAEAVAAEGSCAAASELPETARDNPNRMGVILLMYTILLNLLGDHALWGEGKPGKSGCSRTARLCSLKSPRVKRFL